MDTAYRYAPRSIFIIMFTTAEQILVRRILKCLSLKTCVCVCPRKLRNLFGATSVARAVQWQRAGVFSVEGISWSHLLYSTNHPARNMAKSLREISYLSLYAYFQWGFACNITTICPTVSNCQCCLHLLRLTIFMKLITDNLRLGTEYLSLLFACM